MQRDLATLKKQVERNSKDIGTNSKEIEELKKVI
jgi:hypothetical protein